MHPKRFVSNFWGAVHFEETGEGLVAVLSPLGESWRGAFGS